MCALLVSIPGRSEALDVAAISEIRINPINVFSPEEAAAAFIPYRLANALHITTRERFIKNQLTIAPGDPLTPERLAEAERALRLTRVFTRVTVRAEGTAVVVETQDAWTLFPHFNLSNKGGEVAYTLGLEDANFLGMGRRLDIRYENGPERISRSLFYVDPQIFWPHTTLKLRASDLSDGRNLELGIERPFYALNVRRSGGIFFRNSTHDSILYAGGEESGRYQKAERLFAAETGFLVFASEVAPKRLYGGIEWTDTLLTDEAAPQAGPVDERRFLYLWAGFERASQGWIVTRQADSIDRDEDFNLASSFRVDLGVSLPILGADHAVALKATGSTGTPFGKGFAVFSTSISSRYTQDGLAQTLIGTEARGYQIEAPFTLVFRANVLAGLQLDPETQIQLDALAGLRGYRLHAVAGTGRSVANVEGRYLFASDVLNLVSFGVAAFADAGVSWGDPDGFYRLCDAGVGLRFGLTRASQNALLRLDVARAFRPDPLGRTGWLISFSSGSAF